jgi:hypothetical protein
MKKRPGNPGLRGKLVEKSIEAFILAIETINRLSIKYRVESFCYLMCNAWELLLKAKILDAESNPKSIYYPAKRGEKRRTLALRDCLKRVVSDDADPVRRNLEKVTELRDEACHLVISTVQREVMSLFQACVINYHRKLVEWFDVSLSQRVPVGMMTLVYDYDPQTFDMSRAKMGHQMGADTATFQMKFQAELRDEFSSLGQVPEYSVTINYGLSLEKKPLQADILLTSGSDGALTEVVAVPKQPHQSHPYFQCEIVSMFNALVGRKVINRHDLVCVGRQFRIDQRSDFHYKNPKQGSPQYSEAYLSWLHTQYRRNQRFFANARVWYKDSRVRESARSER